MIVQLPGPARALLERVLPADRREDVIGDLTEVHARRQARSPRLAALLTCGDAVVQAAAFLLFRHRGDLVSERSSAGRLLSDLGADARFALRHLGRDKGFTALVLGTLALGVGSTLALFIVVEGLMLRPLPYPHGERTVVIWQPGAWRAGELDVARAMELEGFEAIGAFTMTSAALRSGEGSNVVRASLLFPGTLGVLGAAPLLGRAFDESDHAPGAADVVIVTHGLWRLELGGDSAALGRPIEVNGRPMIVIGVMPASFFFPDPDVRLWLPLRVDPSTAAYVGRSWLTAVARLRPGTSAALVEQELSRLAAELDARFEYPAGTTRPRESAASPLRKHLLGGGRSVLLLLLAAVGLLLTAATANVAALVSARTHDRRHELSLRRSLGAGTARLVRQLLTEGALIGSAAGVLAVALAASLYRTLVGFLPLAPGFERLPGLDWQLATLAVCLSAALGILATAIPTALLWRHTNNPAQNLRVRSGDGRVHRLQATLVVAQVALALTLISGAALMVRSVGRLMDVELGLDRSDVVVASVSLAQRPAAERRTTYLELANRLAQLPGVGSVGLISHLPLRDLGSAGPVHVEGRPELREAAAPFAYFRIVSPGAFEALGIEVMRGRGFTDADNESAEQVVVVNRSFAEALWPAEDPLGRRIASPGFEGEVWATVIGVAEDVRVDGPTWDPGAVFYRPLAQTSAPAEATFLLSLAGAEDTPVISALRTEAAALDPLIAVHRISNMDDVLRRLIDQPLRLRFFLSLIGSLALAVGSVGVFGMVAYAVGRRTREYGIRMALGADGRRLVRAEVRRAVRTIALGAVVGVGVSLLAARALGSFLFEVRSADPVSIAAALLLLMLVGIGASVLPAARAGRVDPLRSLRED